MKVLMIIALAASIFMRDCEGEPLDSKSLPLVNGVYEGTFILLNQNGSYSGNTSLTITENRFSASGNANRLPAGGSGLYSLANDRQSISFNDENFWTADFDWSLILSGVFQYNFDGNNLIFTRTIGDGTIQTYNLQKRVTNENSNQTQITSDYGNFCLSGLHRYNYRTHYLRCKRANIHVVLRISNKL